MHQPKMILMHSFESHSHLDSLENLRMLSPDLLQKRLKELRTSLHELTKHIELGILLQKLHGIACTATAATLLHLTHLLLQSGHQSWVHSSTFPARRPLSGRGTSTAATTRLP